MKNGEVCEAHTKPAGRMIRSMEYWLEWNRLAESQAHFRIQLETVSGSSTNVYWCHGQTADQSLKVYLLSVALLGGNSLSHFFSGETIGSSGSGITDGPGWTLCYSRDIRSETIYKQAWQGTYAANRILGDDAIG